jgi:hypothetical protein
MEPIFNDNKKRCFFPRKLREGRDVVQYLSFPDLFFNLHYLCKKTEPYTKYNHLTFLYSA